MDIDSRAFRNISYIGIGLLALATVVVLVRSDWLGAALLGAFLLFSILFVAFESKLPALFDTLFVAAAIINAAGWVWGLYRPVWGYDEVAHFFTTFAVTLAIGYLTLYVVREHFRTHRLHYVAVVASFGVTLGAWWEVVEFFLLRKLHDPVGDIIVDSFGALLAGGIAAWTLTTEIAHPDERIRAGSKEKELTG